MATSRDFVYDEQGEMLPSDSSAAAARRKELGITPKMPTRPGQQASGTKAKPKVVTKEELEKSGFDNLRDYMNAKKGLKRRGSSTTEKAPSKTTTKTKPVVSKPADKPAAGTSSLRDPQQMAKQKEAPAASNKKPPPFEMPITRVLRAIRERGDADLKSRGMKKGGRVTASSASKRADGIAQRGKTRGKVY